MPTPFRPNLETLDSRELPSVAPFTFALADGTVVSGTFDYDETAVDATLASQQVPVSDVTVALNGQPAQLAAELVAPVATFALGQFQAVALTAVAVAGNAAALIDTAGTLSPISVTNPAPPLNPITQPAPGVGPIDLTAAQITQYNSNVALLGAYLGRIEDLMDRFDGLSAFIKGLRVQALAARAAGRLDEWRGFNDFADAYFQQLVGISQQLRDAYTAYQSLYTITEAQLTYFRDVLDLPDDQLQKLRPLPTHLVIPYNPNDPFNYFAPLNGLD